jgi:periplasmic protein TonB
MFDTSIVKAHATAAPRRATFLASILIHSIAVVAALALSVSATQLPPEPPKQMELYRPAPPLPAPPAAPRGHPPQPQPVTPRPAPQQPPAQVTAPQQIPDQTPLPVQPATIAAGPADPANPGPIGEPDGRDDGIEGGTGKGGGSVIGGTGTGTTPTIYTPGTAGVTSPKVIRRVEPRFPSQWLHGAPPQATVVVRCIIGHDGQIRDAEIVTSSFTPFNQSVLDALRQWQFEPGKLRGQPVDTYFELTVRFQVVR